MNHEVEEAGSDPVGTQAQLGCGHRIRLPWDLAPEAAVAALLHHQQSCVMDAEGFAPRGMVTYGTAWLPFPQAHR
ncbi:MAG TPA: hypothetical protein VMH49_02410 [Thermoplasmata archaeon]|nr:hypothetical protein [Thermoplasmata archaeon]